MNMAREISGFKDWMASLKDATEGAPLKDALETAAGRARDTWGARIWFVEILGNRWSHLAGKVSARPAGSGVSRLPLAGKCGLVLETWGSLDREKKARLLAFLKHLVISAEDAQNVRS